MSSNDLVSAWVDHHAFTVSSSNHADVHQMLHEHFQALLYNMVSMAAIMALLHDAKRIQPVHMQSLRKYIESQCTRGQRGGTSLPSDYFGYPHAAYTADGSAPSMQIDFSSGVARPSMGPAQLGGQAVVPSLVSKSTWAKTFIKHVLKQRDTSISKRAAAELMAAADTHLQCLSDDIGGRVLTHSLLARTLSLKRHRAFN